MTYVGAEYIIGSLLIAAYDVNKKSITQMQFNEVSQMIQTEFMNKNINAIVLKSNDKFFDELYNFSDYFIYDKNQKTISLNKQKTIDDIRNRFWGYLPIDVLSIIVFRCSSYFKNIPEELS